MTTQFSFNSLRLHKQHINAKIITTTMKGICKPSTFLRRISSSTLLGARRVETRIRSRSYSHDAPSVALVEEAMLLISTQHSHRDGPWQAMSQAVQAHFDEHHNKVSIDSKMADLNPIYKVLDLASGPRGEPATTIAHALPESLVHCTDVCEISVAAVPVTSEEMGNQPNDEASTTSSQPPSNLTKSVANITDLSSFPSNSFHAITCCYGYNLIDELEYEKALGEAYRVLTNEGILIAVNWETSAMHYIGRDVLSGVQRGYNKLQCDYADDESLYFPSPTIEPIVLSSGTDSAIAWNTAAKRAGFFERYESKEYVGSYPFNLGRSPDIQFFMGTSVVRAKLLQLGALARDEYAAGGWSCLAEECFWTNIHKYTDQNERNNTNNNTMWLHGNTFKMTIMRK